MENFYKILFISSLLAVFYQDMRERKVYLFLFLLGIFFGSLIYYQYSFIEVFLVNIGINTVIISAVYLILFVYTKIILRKKLLEAIGFGDFLFFILLAVSFPTIAFLLLFSTSLIFSLLLFLILKSSFTVKTIPLAGLQAFFLSLVLILNWFFNFVNMYAI